MKKTKKTAPPKKWSAQVTKHSDALDLEASVFKLRSARQIALSLKRSAVKSKRRKGSPRQLATSTLNFYVNAPAKVFRFSRKRTLARAKKELRKLFEE